MRTCGACGIAKPDECFSFQYKTLGVRQRRCASCVRIYNAEYAARPENKKKAIERVKAWQAAQPNYLEKRREVWRSVPRDKENLKRREAWLREDVDRRRESRRLNYKKNIQQRREKAKAYKKANPEKVRTHNRNRKARKIEAAGRHTVAEVITLFDAQEGLCANPFCQKVLTENNRHLDHKQPLSRGGRNDVVNLQWLCVSCNLTKRAKTMEEWLGGANN